MKLFLDKTCLGKGRFQNLNWLWPKKFCCNAYSSNHLSFLAKFAAPIAAPESPGDGGIVSEAMLKIFEAEHIAKLILSDP